MTRAGIWLRVSDAGQRRGLEVAQVYQLQESAWRGGHQKVLTQVYQDARKGKFQVLLVWPWTVCPGKGLWRP